MQAVNKMTGEIRETGLLNGVYVIEDDDGGLFAPDVRLWDIIDDKPKRIRHKALTIQGFYKNRG